MTSEKPKRIRWSETEARGILKELSDCGLPIEEFARSRGITGQKLRYWKERLAERAVEFVPVALPAALAGTPAPTRMLEILVDGVVVRVREDLDVEHLAKLVRALARGARPC
jgi:Transposase